ncbi:glycosyltransferase [Capnocytophaga stomatis]|uniref:Glycosyltransferase n=1 Tax=Capnocytophaga stomatis TaxID=1848904 RepID=A0ABW8QAS7_9FLAO|nr:glycosyltransferase [Capnocytophaga stomatis]GIJ93926.1 glycosyl transferase [Capnocytophaga stomatis]
MKVLHAITTLSMGGAEKLIAESISIYQKKGINTDVLILKKGKNSLLENFKTKGNAFFLSKGSVYNPFLILKIVPFLKKYDIIHIHLFPTLYWFVIAKILAFSKTKLIFTEHSTSNRRRNIYIFKFIDRIIYSFLEHIICISDATKENLVKHLNHKKNNISVIYNGINLERFSKINKENNYSFFEEESIILIQVSAFRAEKDQQTVIKSMTQLPEKVKLLLVGEGPLKFHNEELSKKLGLENRIKFLGIRNDIPELYNYSDICILSSHYEGFGLAIVEGMASKKPSIASNVDGLRQIVEGYGLLFRKGDSKHLSEQILYLSNNKEAYGKIAERCYFRAQHFDINKMVDENIKIYNYLSS